MLRVVYRVAVLIVLCVGLARPVAAAPAGEEAPIAAALPPTIQVESLLRNTTTRMLEKSPTFRRQCDIIGAAGHVVVKVRIVPAPRNSMCRATTTFRRYTSGITVADVEIPAASPVVELLAHEFEHIAEYVQGVDLKTLSQKCPGEAFQLRDGSFETQRAVQAGRAVAHEVERK
jgi:hypothetical protein